jgi:hypothetical protein
MLNAHTWYIQKPRSLHNVTTYIVNLCEVDGWPSESEALVRDQDMIIILLTSMSASNFILTLRIGLVRLSNDNFPHVQNIFYLIKHVLLNKTVLSAAYA